MKKEELTFEEKLNQAKLNFVKAVFVDLAFFESLDEQQKEEFINEVVEITKSLSEKEQCVLQSRFGLLSGEKETLSECGESLGVTRQRVREIQERAVRKTRRLYNVKQQLKQRNTEEFLDKYKEVSIIELSLTPTQRWVLERNNIYSVADLLNFYFVNGEIKMRYLLGEGGAKTVVAKLKGLDRFNEMKEKYMQQLEEKANNQDFASISLGGLDLSPRVSNALRRVELNTIQDLIDLYQSNGISGFLRIRNLGRDSLDEILRLLEKYVDLNQLNNDDALNQ